MPMMVGSTPRKSAAFAGWDILLAIIGGYPHILNSPAGTVAERMVHMRMANHFEAQGAR